MMTICTNRQFLSNMLWRLFGFLILGVLIAICSCEPVNRKLLLKTSEIIECIDNGNNTCGTNETFKTSSSDRENETQISRDIRQKSLDDNNVAEGKRKSFLLSFKLTCKFIYNTINNKCICISHIF